MMKLVNPKEEKMKTQTQIKLIKQLRETAKSLEKDLANFDVRLLQELEWRLEVDASSQLNLISSTPKTEKGRELIDNLPALNSWFYQTINSHLGYPLNSSIGFNLIAPDCIFFATDVSHFNDLIAKIGPLDITNIEEVQPKIIESRNAAEKRVSQWDCVIAHLEVAK